MSGNDPKRKSTLSSVTGCDLASPKAQGVALGASFMARLTTKINGAYTVVLPRFLYIWFAAVTLTALVAYKAPSGAQESQHQTCNEDAMIALDASGANVSSWHLADIEADAEHVRFWGQSGHC